MKSNFFEYLVKAGESFIPEVSNSIAHDILKILGITDARNVSSALSTIRATFDAALEARRYTKETLEEIKEIKKRLSDMEYERNMDKIEKQG